MKLQFPRKRHSAEAAGRQRPMPAEQRKTRVFSYYASRSVADKNIGRSPQDMPPKRRAGTGVGALARRRLSLCAAGVIVLAIMVSQLALSDHPKVVVLASADSGPFTRA